MAGASRGQEPGASQPVLPQFPLVSVPSPMTVAKGPASGSVSPSSATVPLLLPFWEAPLEMPNSGSWPQPLTKPQGSF